MTLVIQDIYLKNTTFLWDVSVFFQIFSSRIWGKQGQVRCARSGHCATSDRLGQDGRALDWSSPAGPKSDAQGGLPLGYGSKMIVISFGIIGKYQLISTDIN